MRNEFGEEFFVSEDEYVKSELERYTGDDITDEDRQKLEQEFHEDYRYVQEQIAVERENLPEDSINYGPTGVQDCQ